VIQHKREHEQFAMREALQRQIDEKQRKKDAEKQMLKMQEMRDE